MRSALVLVAALTALPAWGDVRLMIKKDGRKVIYNVGGYASGRATDYNWLAKKRNRASQYDPIIERHALAYGVDPVLVRAVIQVESDFNPSCVSHKGARGLMQLIPATARRWGVQRVHDPDENIRGGVRYLAYLLDLFNYDLPRTLAAYNAGENAVLRYAGIPPYEETTTYVKRALTVYYGRPYGQAVSYAGGRGRGTLRGGLQKAVQPIAAMQGMRYLGSQ
ncbi:MAG TPA: lytic transglycosylase domain-containing protein [Thermoanaerobaculia bacterium]|nr:lytic transglycosylase domain-containing protein [Thermoanaerobaculia bacterium]